MPDFFKMKYEGTGKSKKTDALGMREMQQIAFRANTAQYLLIKAPPASGKSRALMFIALEKLHHQDIKKVIVAVPERNIGASFKATNLTKDGFFADWSPNPHYNLCTASSNKSKVDTFIEFMQSDEQILICTHSTLRFACAELDEKQFNDCLIAIDEFHHVSAEDGNRLGEVMKNIMTKSKAHIVAMTGSYFRGDSVPVLLPEDEMKFTKVTYTFYQQLNGYEYLKSLAIGHHFYTGRYYEKPSDKDISPLEEVLDVNKKTIIHIPSVNSSESSKDKMSEVQHILDILGDFDDPDPETGVIYVKNKKTGKTLKVADLVNDEPKDREKISHYLRTMEGVDAIDIIIALGMAKEGFDWPYCEHALTIGSRGSLTEILQIIGRTIRDSPNKTHAQFTNLIAEPEPDGTEVKITVNNTLKAITASLLMEQVLAPNFNFKLKSENPEEAENDKKNDDDNTIRVGGFKPPSSERSKEIIERDLNDLNAKILQDETMLKAMPGNVEPEVITKILIPKIIKETYPDLNEEEVEEIRQHVLLDFVFKNDQIEQGGKKFIRMANRFINIDEINIDLIDQINPFQKSFEILSKSITAKTLKIIDDYIKAIKIQMTEEEAVILWPKIIEFRETTGHLPDIYSFDQKEKRMAEAVIYLKEIKRKRQMGQS